ncbi:MAG: basic amino acid ABC transporter substrate-binding protein [Clostridiaceae bacterium]
MKKMKKIAMLLLTVVFAAAMFAGCAQKQTAKDTSLDDIKKAGVIKIGMDAGYAPFEMVDNNSNIVGFDVDLGNKIAEKLGVKAEFVNTSFNGIIVALTSDKFDMIISGLSVTDERKLQIAFAGPYLQSAQTVIVSSDNTEIKSIADLKGKVIGVQLGSTGEVAANKLEGLKEIKSYDAVPDELIDLATGRLDAVIVDKPVGGYYVTQSSNKDAYKTLDEALVKEDIGIGLEKEDAALTAEVQKIYDGLVADGTMSKISVKWFGYDAYAK